MTRLFVAGTWGDNRTAIWVIGPLCPPMPEATAQSYWISVAGWDAGRCLDALDALSVPVAAVQSRSADKGFRVLHTHDVAATLAENGFPRDPLKIVEICNAKYASQVLAKDAKIALMLPCPISVYTQGGRTLISTMLPTSIVEFFPNAGIGDIATEVEATVLEIVNEASGGE